MFSYPDTGLVSVIASSYLVNSLRLAEIGAVESPALSHIAVIHNGFPRPPTRIYAGATSWWSSRT